MDTEKYWNPVLETMPRENLERFQLKKFKRTMQYAIDHSPFYQRKYEEAAKEIKRLSCGMKAIDVNTDAILVYSYILNQNVTDILDMDV